MRGWIMINIEPSVIIAIITLFSAPIATIVAWTVSRRKQHTDVASSIAHASGEAVDAIRDVLESLRLELDDTKKELEMFKKMNDELQKSLTSLKEQNIVLLKQNALLASEILELRNSITDFSQNGSQ